MRNSLRCARCSFHRRARPPRTLLGGRFFLLVHVEGPLQEIENLRVQRTALPCSQDSQSVVDLRGQPKKKPDDGLFLLHLASYISWQYHLAWYNDTAPLAFRRWSL